MKGVAIMREACKGISKTLLIVVLVAVIAAASTGVYSVIAYPRIMVSFPVSFTFGADVERQEFSVPILHDSVQVEVVVNSGNMLWTAKILSLDDILWSHSAHQPGQTVYRSEWIGLSSGNYNFTFAAGLGPLEAEIKVTSKGGFW